MACGRVQVPRLAGRRPGMACGRVQVPRLAGRRPCIAVAEAVLLSDAQPDVANDRHRLLGADSQLGLVPEGLSSLRRESPRWVRDSAVPPKKTRSSVEMSEAIAASTCEMSWSRRTCSMPTPNVDATCSISASDGPVIARP